MRFAPFLARGGPASGLPKPEFDAALPFRIVVILVNEHTSSAAEMLAAFAEENGLATIVGTTTAGRLLSGSTFRAGSGYILGLPVAAYLTWQGRLIEGKGVTPSVPVELPADRLVAGEDPPKEKTLELAKGI